jgi:hypothetical protein
MMTIIRLRPLTLFFSIALVFTSNWIGFSAPQPNYINLALDRAAYQSSSLNDDNTAQMATDGLPGTHWDVSSSTQQWIYVDLGRECRVSRVRLDWGADFASEYSLQSSPDIGHPTAWVTFYRTQTGSGGNEIIATHPIVARYVRLLLASTTAFSQFTINEFEIDGTGPTVVKVRPSPTLLNNGDYLLTGGDWRVQNASLVTGNGSSISNSSYDDLRWIPATVPGTVLTSYYNAGVIPDPMYGEQIYEISNSFFTNNDFWYRDTFMPPKSFSGKRIWLNFDGINWKADIYVNGVSVGNIDGAFIRRRFDVTSYAVPGQKCVIAVLVHKNDNPGPVKHKTLNFMPHNGGILGLDSPTFLASQGWNWMPAIPGRDNGIWNDVYLSSSGPVSIVDPFVTTSLPLPDVSQAELAINVRLQNNSPTPQQGRLVGSIDGGITFQFPVSLSGGETKSIELNKGEFPQLHLVHPRLWWPNGMGEANLYRLRIAFQIGGHNSDSNTITFGVRQFSYELRAKSTLDAGTLYLSINGKRILVRGGNWGMDEAMLRYDAAKYDIAVRLHKEMNINMIRVWIGMVGKDAFFDACDKYGILVWNDFWLANPGDGPNPTDNAMFVANADDRILALRNHPSLMLYCGRNEGYPSTLLEGALRSAVNQLDGTRDYISSSLNPPVSGGGPYVVQTPGWYFRNQGESLHTELGIVAAPDAESVRAMFPQDHLWPIDDFWGLHDFCNDGYSNRALLYIQMINKEYGIAGGLDDFCRKAQMLNLETATAMCEANQNTDGSGMMIWLTHPAWPSLTCQSYDYYFEPTAAYYGIKKGNEPIHIFWNRSTDVVRVVNDTTVDLVNATARAELYDFSGRMIWSNSSPIYVASGKVATCFPLEKPLGFKGIYFLKLTLVDDGTRVSDNFYWANTDYLNYVALDSLPKVRLRATCEEADATTPDCRTLKATLTNSSNTVALEVHLEVRGGATNYRVLPVYFDDNYFSLMPGEVRTITITVPRNTEKVLTYRVGLRIGIDGWNISPEEVLVAANPSKPPA